MEMLSVFILFVLGAHGLCSNPKDDNYNELLCQKEDCGVENCGGDRRLEQDFQEDLACKVPMEAAFKMWNELDNVNDSPTIENALETPIERAQQACFDLAEESIVKLGKMLENEPELSIEMLKSKKKMLFLFQKIIHSKQCMAYLELAKRSEDPELLLQAWLASGSEPQKQDQACGEIVNSVNAHLLKNEIPNGSTETVDAKEVIVVQEFPMGDRLQVAERKAGLEKILAEVIAVGSTMAASMLAGFCKRWQQDTLGSL